MEEQSKIPIDTRSLFQSLDNKLIELLKSLESEDWNRQTVAKEWRVKDVASHLLDGNLRTLSIQRDRYFGETPPKIQEYQDLVGWLNQLNADWVNATKRISPSVLVLLLEATGELTSEYFASLDPWNTAIFPVDWAGESTSYNWMHTAREYTEKWHHQQQIRDATRREGIITKEFFYPVMNTFFQALPYTFRDTEAETGTVIKSSIMSQAGGTWFLTKAPDAWLLTSHPKQEPAASVEIPIEISWKLFSKSLRPDDVTKQITIKGDKRLGRKVLDMVSVMAWDLSTYTY